MKITVEKTVGDIKTTYSLEDEWKKAATPEDFQRYVEAIIKQKNGEGQIVETIHMANNKTRTYCESYKVLDRVTLEPVMVNCAGCWGKMTAISKSTKDDLLKLLADCWDLAHSYTAMGETSNEVNSKEMVKIGNEIRKRISKIDEELKCS